VKKKRIMDGVIYIIIAVIIFLVAIGAFLAVLWTRDQQSTAHAHHPDYSDP